MQTFKENKQLANEFENNSHIARKKRAAANQSQFHKKNKKEILELIDADDDEDENIEQYVRYIK